jgi:hypothetical protein
VTDQGLADELAIRVLGWRKAPGRYIMMNRSWISESRFRPLVDVRDAFRVLDAVTNDYALVAISGGVFTAMVSVAGRVGRATGEPKARAISLAVARAMALDIAPEAGDACPPVVQTNRVRGRNRG